MSNQTVLDAGQPPPPFTVSEDENGNPVVDVDEPGSDAANASLRHSNAVAAVMGTQDTPTDWGTHIRRVPVALTGLTVDGDRCTVGPGAVLAVQATTGGTTGPVAIVLVGSPSPGEVYIEPSTDGTQALEFAAADAVTECAVYLLPSSADLIAVLDAAADPPE